MFEREWENRAVVFGETLLQLAPSCGSLADSCRSGELGCVSSVFVQYGPLVCGKGAKCVRAIWTTRLWKRRETWFTILCVCKQQQEQEQRGLLKLVELRRTSRSGKGVLQACFASKWPVRTYFGGARKLLRHSGCEHNSHSKCM
jgi:hypothetical protein